jgi:hypothetical protein
MSLVQSCPTLQTYIVCVRPLVQPHARVTDLAFPQLGVAFFPPPLCVGHVTMCRGSCQIARFCLTDHPAIWHCASQSLAISDCSLTRPVCKVYMSPCNSWVTGVTYVASKYVVYCCVKPNMGWQKQSEVFWPDVRYVRYVWCLPIYLKTIVSLITFSPCSIAAYFIILLCLKPDDFTCQVESVDAQSVKFTNVME